jgi:hypothetical protein
VSFFQFQNATSEHAKILYFFFNYDCVDLYQVSQITRKKYSRKVLLFLEPLLMSSDFTRSVTNTTLQVEKCERNEKLACFLFASPSWRLFSDFERAARFCDTSQDLKTRHV